MTTTLCWFWWFYAIQNIHVLITYVTLKSTHPLKLKNIWKHKFNSSTTPLFCRFMHTPFILTNKGLLHTLHNWHTWRVLYSLQRYQVIQTLLRLRLNYRRLRYQHQHIPHRVFIYVGVLKHLSSLKSVCTLETFSTLNILH